jgi:hypothetical protein
MNNILNEFIKFKSDINIIVVFDHARSGNGFFQTIFDDHDEVLACPWLHYVYSYNCFNIGSDDIWDSELVHKLWTTHNHYFKLLYHDLDQSSRDFINVMGGNIDSIVDRSEVRSIFDFLVLSNSKISRKDFILSVYFSIAAGLGKDINKIKYVLLADTISLRSEKPITGYSAKVIDQIVYDFPDSKLIHLERDPRAGMASLVHQFTNQLGNGYGLKIGNFWHRLIRLIKLDFDRDSVWVFGFWLLHVKAAYNAISKKKLKYHDNFIDVKNEDLNLDFVNAMRDLSNKIGFQWYIGWDKDFKPTMLGFIWKGTGAYNNQYQTFTNGPMANDSIKVSNQSASPNKHVTTRWKSKLKKNEIAIIEVLLQDEMKNFAYPFIYFDKNNFNSMSFYKILIFPLKGEIPSFSWIKNGFKDGFGELANRFFYLVFFPFFYITVRIIFLRIVYKHLFLKTQ